jgi:uncharacterized protein (DUF2336 family)
MMQATRKTIESNLVNFEALEREPNTERRNDLMRNVTYLFALTANTCSQEQIDVYDDVLSRLADMVTHEVLADVAEKIAPLAAAPSGIVKRLAREDISVAKPILARSPILTDRDLVEIATRCGLFHMNAIATRGTLSATVADLLIEKGDGEVRRTVAANPGARPSDFGFLALARHAMRREDNLDELLADRPDLPEAVIHILVRDASEKARQKLVALGQTRAAERVDQVARLAADRMNNDYWLHRYDFEGAWTIMLREARCGRVDEPRLRAAALEDRFADATALFALVTGISLEEAKHWLVRTDTEPFVIVAKAHNLSIMTVQALLSCGAWRFRLDADERARVLSRYANLPVGQARRLFTTWKAASSTN